ncbi:MAG: ribonuclease III [Acholeplasmatales bacterium]|jgi:ribonuclease-3|nr:ribonuclease III [Acholeplasmatales bacterium]
MPELTALLQKFQLEPKYLSILQEAFTHSSYAHEMQTKSYERLEFLGDAVIQIIVSELLYELADLDEGSMTKLRSKYVSKPALSFLCEKSGLINYIKYGNSLHNLSKKNISDCVESFFGAIYRTDGLLKAKQIYLQYFYPLMNEYHFVADSKTQLQEIMQAHSKRIEYRVTDYGPSHDKEFKAEVFIDGLIYGVGTGKTKQEAEQMAATSALDKGVSQ